MPGYWMPLPLATKQRRLSASMSARRGLKADVIARTDEMPVVTLEDGSEVQLNVSSAIAVDFARDLQSAWDLLTAASHRKSVVRRCDL